MHLSFDDFIPFLASCVSPESMFSSESGGKRTLLVGVMDGPFRFKSIEEGAEEHGIEVFRVHPLFQTKCTEL